MQFSLRSRFRGAFLGAALGEVFGTALQNLPLPDRFAQPPKANRPRPIVALTRRLVEPVTDPSASGSVESEQTDPQLPSTIDFLPLMLLSHESPERVQHSLLPQIANLPPEQQSEILTIAQIVSPLVSQILQEQFLPDRLIPALLEQSHLREQSADLAAQLQQIHTWLTDLTPIAMLSPVELSPLAAALYGFLKTPASLSLALRHTLRLQPDPEAAALVGLFAGTHLSEAGLPLGWRQELDRRQSATLQSRWGISSTVELHTLSDQIWATWSGAFQPQQPPAEATVTAVPRLIRPR